MGPWRATDQRIGLKPHVHDAVVVHLVRFQVPDPRHNCREPGDVLADDLRNPHVFSLQRNHGITM